MQARGKPLAVSLVTGEERRLVPGATHVASTVEMLDTRTEVDVAVIDEIQMLADRDRGAAWTAAVCGAPAHTVYLVGAPEARRAIEARRASNANWKCISSNARAAQHGADGRAQAR
jgi:ATP-dependent RNA helicase SUPV3L1/SUV3